MYFSRFLYLFSLLDERWLAYPSYVVLGFCNWQREMFTDTHERHFFCSRERKQLSGRACKRVWSMGYLSRNETAWAIYHQIDGPSRASSKFGQHQLVIKSLLENLSQSGTGNYFKWVLMSRSLPIRQKYYKTKPCFSLDGHNTKDLIYKWKGDTVSVEKKSMAQFDMKRVQLISNNMTYVSG